jgi:hypothetical protein
MSPQQQAIVQAIEAAGEHGISRAALVVTASTTVAGFRQQLLRIREAGVSLYASTRLDGGLYFSQREWKEAADAVYHAEVKARKKAQQQKWTQIRMQRDKEATAAKRAARLAAKLVTAEKPRTVKPKKGPKPAQAIVVRQARQPLNHAPVVVHQPRVTGETKITIAPAFVDRRWLPDVVRPVVNPAECRPWAVAAVESRAA